MPLLYSALLLVMMEQPWSSLWPVKPITEKWIAQPCLTWNQASWPSPLPPPHPMLRLIKPTTTPELRDAVRTLKEHTESLRDMKRSSDGQRVSIHELQDAMGTLRSRIRSTLNEVSWGPSGFRRGAEGTAYPSDAAASQSRLDVPSAPPSVHGSVSTMAAAPPGPPFHGSMSPSPVKRVPPMDPDTGSVAPPLSPTMDGHASMPFGAGAPPVSPHGTHTRGPSSLYGSSHQPWFGWDPSAPYVHGSRRAARSKAGSRARSKSRSRSRSHRSKHRGRRRRSSSPASTGSASTSSSTSSASVVTITSSSSSSPSSSFSDKRKSKKRREGKRKHRKQRHHKGRSHDDGSTTASAAAQPQSSTSHDAASAAAAAAPSAAPSANQSAQALLQEAEALSHLSPSERQFVLALKELVMQAQGNEAMDPAQLERLREAKLKARPSSLPLCYVVV